MIKIVISILCGVSIMLSGCASNKPPGYQTSAVKAPSARVVKKEIDTADKAVERARVSSKKVGEGIDRTRTRAERIDYKATLLLENW